MPLYNPNNQVTEHVAEVDPHTQYQKESELGIANGYASLNASGKVPVAQLPNAIMEYQGTWDASTNTPSLADGSGNADSDVGNVYRVSVSGTQDLGSGSIAYVIGDYVILNSSKVWEKSDTTDSVASVDGRTGTVTLNDLYSAAGHDHDADYEPIGEVNTHRAEADAHPASKIDNDSGVDGATVADALDTLKSDGVISVTSSDVSTTSASNQDATGLSFSVAANEVWVGTMMIRSQCSGAGGVKFGVNAPAGASVTLQAIGSSTSNTAFEAVGNSAIDGQTAALNRFSSQGLIHANVIIQNGANAGTVQVRFAAGTAGQTATVRSLSTLIARRQ